MEAEIGRLDVSTHRAERGNRTVYNAKVDLFPKVGPKEMHHTACYDGLELRLVSYMPYRKVEEVMNHLRWQDDEDKIKHRTLADAVVREGAEIINYLDVKGQEILIQNHFDVKSGKPDKSSPIKRTVEYPEILMIPSDQVNRTIAEYNEGREEERRIDGTRPHEGFEDPAHSVNISVDDVGVTEQKENGRSKYSEPKETKHYVKNTVIHIQQGVSKYILDGLGIRKMLILLTAFLLHNDLFDNKAIIFFTDGADDIKNAIKDIFGWRPYRIILDWYHLKKKCKERLSMAMKGRQVRNETLKKLLSLLWLGKIDTAIEYLSSLDVGKVRNSEHIDKLIAYFNKNSSYIPCYALRQKLGLRVSSNRGEKANDLVVAQRQKHNGMSWSKPGSSGLANVRALFLNKEDENWITHKELDFKLIQSPEKKCA